LIARLPFAGRVVLASAITVSLLTWSLAQGRAFAAWFVVENGPVEAVQGLLLAVGLALIARRAERLAALGRSTVPEVVLVYGLTVLLAGELEAWSFFFGRALTTHRVLAMSRTRFACAMVAMGLIVAISLAVAIHVLRHLQEFLGWGMAALGTGWGRVLVLGLLIFAITEMFERRLNWILPTVFPKTFLEEGLELLANTFFVLSLRERDRVDPVGPAPRSAG
jgi:hypothetical protein